jgi:hypothetical protein
LSALTRGQNVDGTPERSENLEDLSNLRRGLACFEIDNGPQADASNAGKLVLPQVLFFTCNSNQGADIGWASDLFCHRYFSRSGK